MGAGKALAANCARKPVCGAQGYAKNAFTNDYLGRRDTPSRAAISADYGKIMNLETSN